MDAFLQMFIDPIEWDSAGWKATVFLHDPTGLQAPCLGIMFKDIDAGRQIFSRWRERLGRLDRYDKLRISIVEGEILGLDSGCSVHISSDPDRTEERATNSGVAVNAETVVIIGRILRMTPEPGSPHLSRFKKDFAKHGRYLLIPISADLIPEFDFTIEKRRVLFRQAMEIVKTDRDAVVFPEHYFDDSGVVH